MSGPPPPPTAETSPLQARIIAAGLKILAEGDRDALTTRAVAAAAGVQAPTIYRLFGDKHGLMNAVAAEGMQQFVQQKQAQVAPAGPLDDLRAGWEMTVAFGLAYPAIFTFLNAEPKPGPLSPVIEAGADVLKRKIARIAASGHLRVSEERALGLVRAAGVGVVLTLLGTPKERRDLALSTAALEAVIAAITSTQPAVAVAGPTGAAIALRASLGDATVLTPGERHLLAELLDRLAAGDSA